MVPDLFHLVLQSVRFYKKPVLYKVLIIALLSAVITGSLLTGRSVQTSLKRSAAERLGNTGILVSSGIRSFDAKLVQRMKDSAAIICSGIYEIYPLHQFDVTLHQFDIYIYIYLHYTRYPLITSMGGVAGLALLKKTN